MDNDRTRPFLLEPVYRGAPVSWSESYFQGRLRQYRDNHPEFDEYLINIGNEITKRELTYCENILLFVKGYAKTNWVSPARSLFKTFIKFFNYDFSSKQTVDYIEKCYLVYEFLMNNKYEMDKEYNIFSKSCAWDNNTRDFVHLYLNPVNKPKDLDEYFWIDINFCSLQVPLGSDHFGDTEIKIRSGRDIYEDALSLFDRFQESKFLHKCLDTAISELRKYRVIEKPHQITGRFYTALFYRINKPHSLRIEDNNGKEDL